jgi:hypothetical protein
LILDRLHLAGRRAGHQFGEHGGHLFSDTPIVTYLVRVVLVGKGDRAEIEYLLATNQRAMTSSGCRSSNWLKIGTIERARMTSGASTVTGPAFD